MKPAISARQVRQIQGPGDNQQNTKALERGSIWITLKI
jgi:hypothetical protein